MSKVKCWKNIFIYIFLITTTLTFAEGNLKSTILNIPNSTSYTHRGSAFYPSKTLISIDTKYTISKVAILKQYKENAIIGVSYEGILFKITYRGIIKWKNNIGKGIVCNDIWCSDINGDGVDEILVAMGDGSIQCINADGKIMWKFKPNNAPMISVCSIHKIDGSTYVACGGNDLNIYYLSPKGQQLKKIPSSSYPSLLRTSKKWNDDAYMIKNVHSTNFLRPLKQKNGSDNLLLIGITSSNDQRSVFFQFKPMASKPFKTFLMPYGHGPIGSVQIEDINKDGNYEVIFGSSGMQFTTNVTLYNPNNNKLKLLKLSKFTKQMGAGYRVAQAIVIPDGDSYKYITKLGSNIFVTPPSFLIKDTKNLKCEYSFNDICKDEKNNKIILASCQSGGSCIHILDYTKPNWEKEYSTITPPGNIQSILDNTKKLHEDLNKYTKASWERKSVDTYVLNSPTAKKRVANKPNSKYDNPKYLGYAWNSRLENWDRSSLTNQTFRDTKDNRKKYDQTQKQILDKILPKINDQGLCTWGGHGTDPYYYSPKTLYKIIKANKSKKTVFIWPELTIINRYQFDFVLNNLFYPLANYITKKGYDTNLLLRTKYAFWISEIYTPAWSRFLSGEFANILVPGMEETQSLTMELSLAGRLGLWCSGVANHWATRCAMDNTSYVRNRQFSHQNLPNHFLRSSIYRIAYGANFINNYSIDSKYSDYMDVLMELIAKGALYVPRKKDIVSFSPVHIAMEKPDKYFETEADGNPSSIRYNKDFYTNNPYVFSHLDGTWSGAKVTKWDFSRYAANVIDRRLNFLPGYNNGMVLITPPQKGIYADENAPRGKLIDHLNPLYKNITKEYLTDGRNYYSADGKKIYKADEYYKTVEKDIKDRSKYLPLTVSGNVAWVAAQISPKHLRLTIIDGGYINPSDKVAIVKFQSVKPVKMTDVLDGKAFDISDKANVKVDIPCGLFRFIDVELDKPLQ